MAAIIVFAVLVASLAAVGFATAPPAHAADGNLSHVASASTAANQASHSVQIPNAAQAGDSLLLFMITNDSTITVSTPSGWTQIESVDGNGVRGRAWTRTATAGIVGTNVTVTASAAVKAVLSVAAYRSSIGSPTISASESSVVNTSASSHTTPSVDVAGANSWLVNYWVRSPRPRP